VIGPKGAKAKGPGKFQTRPSIEKPFEGNLKGATADVTGPHAPLQQVANDYMASTGRQNRPQQEFVNVDPGFAKTVADAYEHMAHAPNDPKVAAAYKAMIDETGAQYNALKGAGYNFEFMPASGDPYGNPRNAVKDLQENKHMYVFPTESGFGSGEITNNPLLGQSGETWGGKPVTHNDLFRAVHDAFGHSKQGVGFRARGEENAFQQHMGMYSPEAARAMASETRGQNSWVNFGPHGEANKTASPTGTVYAEQKTGLLPDEMIFGRTNREQRPVDITRGQGRKQRGALNFSDEDPFAPGSGSSEANPGFARATALRGGPVSEAPYPGIHSNPRELVANANVAPEDAIMRRLFGVDRQDLFDISKGGTRQGNIAERPYKAAANARGSAAAQEVATPENAARMQDIIGAARERPDLFKGMASWYTMDPLYDQFVKMYGPEEAINQYKRFNTFTGMASPGSEVLTELNRGTAARMMADKGKFEDFMKYGGQAEHERGRNFPKDLKAVIGHPYHSTAQAVPMAKFQNTGNVEMGSAKVPSYIAASGVPETGFQTQWPVGDAHWSRLIGLPETRTMRPEARGASASVPEMTTLTPWWQEQVAKASGLESVPAQAVAWGAGSHATGITSPIGAPKLELLAQQIEKTAQRLKVSPETARDLVIAGKAHAGHIDPKLAAAIAAAAAAITGGNNAAE